MNRIRFENVSLPLEFIVVGPPVSLNADPAPKRKWKERVNRAAKSSWKPSAAVIEDVAVLIDYFCYDTTPGRTGWIDVDNVPKPVLDALEGLVFKNDNQVIDIACRRRNLFDAPRIGNVTVLLYPYLDRTDPFLRVKISSANAQELSELNL